MGLQIYCDGCINQFGVAYCLITKHGGIKKGKRKTVKIEDKIKTNIFEVELDAINNALRLLLSLPNERATIFSDNLNVIKFINNKEVRDNLDSVKVFHHLMNECILENKKLTFLWKSREQNIAGNYLEDRLNTLKKRFR